MLKTIKIVLFLLIGLSVKPLLAQQIPVSFQYSVNPYTLSPAYAGYDENVDIYINYRKEWGNIEGAPQTSFVNGALPISKNAWLGGQFLSDKTDILKIFYGHLSYSYHVKINNTQFLHFGMWGSIYQNTIDLNNLIVTDPIDPIISGKTHIIGTSFNVGASALYQYQDGVIGVTLPYMIKEQESYAPESNNNVFVMQRMAIIHASYNLRLSYDWEIQPFIVYRFAETANSYFEFSARFRYRDNYWTGLMFRSEGKVGINFGGLFTENLIFNYSYEFASKGIVARPSPTHEFTLGFRLPTGKKFNMSKWRRYIKMKNNEGN